MEKYRPIFFAVTFVFLGAAFYMTYRPRAARGPSRIIAINKVMLWAVTLVAGFFLFCPQYLVGMASADGGFTAEMTRSAIVVEGMTCPG